METDIDVSQRWSANDTDNENNLDRRKRQNQSYFKDFWHSFDLFYLKHKWFNNTDWSSAFCSSSFDLFNRWPKMILIYRTFLFLITVSDLLYGMIRTRPVYEWPIYYTHITLFVTFLAVICQLLTACLVNCSRQEISPRHSLQYIHMILILLALGAGLGLCGIFWTMIYYPGYPIRSPVFLDHGILWFLFLIDIFLFTRLAIYMIDIFPLILFGCIYVVFTILIFCFKTNLSNNRIGYIYRALNLNNAPIRVSIQLILFGFVMPIGIVFVLWNLFRLRRTIDLKSTIQQDHSSFDIAL